MAQSFVWGSGLKIPNSSKIHKCTTFLNGSICKMEFVKFVKVGQQ